MTGRSVPEHHDAANRSANNGAASSSVRGRATVPHDRDRIDQLADEILAHAERFGYPKASRFAIKLAFEEAITNAFVHGHEGLPDDLEVTVDYEVAPESVTVSIEDQGPGFHPDAVPDPTLDENLDKPFGRGLMLMRAYMHHVAHNDRGNRVELRYDRTAS